MKPLLRRKRTIWVKEIFCMGLALKRLANQGKRRQSFAFFGASDSYGQSSSA
jgi:hypothetical protein